VDYKNLQKLQKLTKIAARNTVPLQIPHSIVSFEVCGAYGSISEASEAQK